eukprot:TRINITY_DN5438_c0_g1_i1.p1 TRINITY_DN5438_c0_g1~~TRINITY_DN5438_c0_g1_i1.p1  ORF type:complete len:158 (+),score=32.00 TRINITY_DN5438_c0_g1_i1:58-474(+)
MQVHKTWLLATDGSDCSFRALENISRIWSKDDTVVFLIVAKTIRFDVDDYKERKEKQDKECELKLKRFKELCKKHNIKFNTEISQGDPREIILSSSKKHHANYIVMGSRGMTGLKSILMGSVSTYVVEQSTIPVLIVK